MIPPPPTVWPQTDGAPVSCREKLRMLAENHAELAQALQDAFEDAVLMGVDEQAMRRILAGHGRGPGIAEARRPMRFVDRSRGGGHFDALRARPAASADHGHAADAVHHATVPRCTTAIGSETDGTPADATSCAPANATELVAAGKRCSCKCSTR